MQKLAILKFFVPIAIITSVFSGLVYNLLAFLNIWVLETHWGFYYNVEVFANLMALSFFLFTFIFIISTRFIEKILKDHFIVLGILVIGFCCIYASLIYIWELVFLVFILASATTGFLVPMMIKYISNIVQEKYENKRYLLVLPISALIWIGVSILLFNILGANWRMLYAVTGIINVLSTLVFFKF